MGKYLDWAEVGTRVWVKWPAERKYYLGTVVQNYPVSVGEVAESALQLQSE